MPKLIQLMNYNIICYQFFFITFLLLQSFTFIKYFIKILLFGDFNSENIKQ